MAFRETAPGRCALPDLRRDLRGEFFLNGWGLVSASPRLTADECRDGHLYLMKWTAPLTVAMCQNVELFMAEISTIGLDLAEHVFQVHGVDDQASGPEFGAPVASRGCSDRFGLPDANGTSPRIASHPMTAALP
jgi:hypothetical protein